MSTRFYIHSRKDSGIMCLFEIIVSPQVILADYEKGAGDYERMPCVGQEYERDLGNDEAGVLLLENHQQRKQPVKLVG